MLSRKLPLLIVQSLTQLHREVWDGSMHFYNDHAVRSQPCG